MLKKTFEAGGILHQITYYKHYEHQPGHMCLIALCPSDQKENFGYVPPSEIIYHTEEELEALVTQLTDTLNFLQEKKKELEK